MVKRILEPRERMMSMLHRPRRLLSMAFCATVSLCVIAAVFPAKALELQPHRAVYDVKLLEARQGSGITDVAGQMTVSLEHTCGGWTLAQKLDMDVDTVKGGPIAQSMNYAGLETDDGLGYRFMVRNQFGMAKEVFRGSAAVSPHEPGEALYTAPEEKRVKLPGGVLFPIAHTRALIQAAQAGEQQLSRMIFDGSSGDGAQEVVAFFGGATTAQELGMALDNALTAGPGWIMRLAYFDPESRSETPSFEIGVFQLPNGIAPRLTLDYDIFRINLDLKDVEALKDGCAGR